MYKIISFVSCLLLLASCNLSFDNDPDKEINPEVTCTKYGLSTVSLDEAYTALKTALDNNDQISIVAEVDHAQNAASVGKELGPTKIIFFGKPNLGTPLMQESQTIGLDLPQKILVWEDAEGAVHLSYNDPEFLRQRHLITGSDTEIQKITNALHNITNAAAGSN